MTASGRSFVPSRSAQLPATAMSALADMVEAGFGLAKALEILPRKSLSARVARRLESEIAPLRAGAPLDVALDRLGLEITASAVRGSRSRPDDLVAALRADAESRVSRSEALRRTRTRVTFFAVIVGLAAVSGLYFALVSVPEAIEKSTAKMPPDWPLPAMIARYEQSRDLWLGFGASILLLIAAAVLLAAGILGRDRGLAFLHDLRLRVPFLRGHALQSSTARLLEALVYVHRLARVVDEVIEALAHEQAAGISANETLRRLLPREPVPRLRADLELAGARLNGGDPWGVCLRGTLLDHPLLADLADLGGHGARPTQGYRWAAAKSRETSIRDLRHAIITAAVLVLVPATIFLAILMQIASTTAIVAELESVRQQIQELTDAAQSIIENQ